MKRILVVLFLLLGQLSFSQTEEAIRNPDTMPEFPGGNEAMMKFITANLKHPEREKSENQGAFGCKSIIEFTIDKNGFLKNAYAVRSCVGCSACDAEAIKVFEKMPQWKPGIKDNKPVDVKMGLPVFFSFK